MKIMKFKISKIFLLFLFFVLPIFSFAQSSSQKQIFFVDPGFDLKKREKILATNVLISEKASFYIDDEFWFSLPSFQREKLFLEIVELSREFDFKIYPILTQTLGKIERGVKGDEKITILFEPMQKEVGGYSREADNFEKILVPTSNERRMIYLNSAFFGDPILKSFLAHEFTHLIIFDQKTKKLNLQEERWLQEMIAEIAPTILGYPENLEKRMEAFKKYFKDPILEWKDTEEDYVVLSIFSHYLLDQFGPQFFSEILQTKEVGVLAIEKVSQKNFSELFRNFALASYLNNCSIDPIYCYKNEKLKKLKVVPEIQYLPITGPTFLSILRETKDFSLNFYSFYGGKGNLTFEFEGQGGNFDVTLLLCDKKETCQIQFLTLEEAKKGNLYLPNFTQTKNSFTAIIFSKNSRFIEGEAPKYNFSLKISFGEETPPFIQPSLPTPSLPSGSLSKKPTLSCQNLSQNLKYGMKSQEVFCLQEFLKAQGAEIYPEGLVTGYFGPLTFSAVKRFQQKYWQEILAPWGLKKEEATGFVGPTTRAKINQLLKGES